MFTSCSSNVILNRICTQLKLNWGNHQSAYRMFKICHYTYTFKQGVNTTRTGTQYQQITHTSVSIFDETGKVLVLTNKSTWNSELQFILFRKQGHNARKNGSASEFAFTVFGNKSWSYFDFHANLLMKSYNLM